MRLVTDEDPGAAPREAPEMLREAEVAMRRAAACEDVDLHIRSALDELASLIESHLERDESRGRWS